MDLKYTYDAVPNEFTEYLKRVDGSMQFRRRAVLTNEHGSWELLCCVVQGFMLGESVPEPLTSRQYRHAVLYEDLLTSDKCLEFANELQQGHLHFDGISCQRGPIQQWATELVPVTNDYMERAGYVISIRLGQQGARAPASTLLAPDQPYYPDIDDAARDWLPFRVYHGQSDARNDQIFFLLPETRAFIANAVNSEEGVLDILIAGVQVDDLDLLIKGAYWLEKKICHFEAPVRKSKVVLAVPAETDRLEYYLIDHTAQVYDFHKEDRFSLTRRDRRQLGSFKKALAGQVRDAVEKGEGSQIEFKPFVSPDQPLNLNGQKTKLLEIITTAVAFANADGGYIYLGIDDDCSVTGIDQKLIEWGKAAIDEPLVARYLGALKSKIKDKVHGELVLNLSQVEIDGALVVVIEIPQAIRKPIAIQQDNYLYARIGASNRKVPPDQWRDVLESSTSDQSFNWRQR